MNIMNADLKQFCEFLMSIETDGKNSRMRMRFIKLANERLTEIEEERVMLVNKYSEKDNDNNPIVTEHEDGTRTVKLTEPDEFNREFTELMFEQFIVSDNDERKSMLESIQNIVLNAKGPFSGDYAFIYERWCQIVEGISS